MIGLTQRQSDLMRFITGYQAANDGVSPTFEEMAKAMGHANSRSGVHRLMLALAERGYIKRTYSRARAIEILQPLPIPHLDGEPLHMVARFD